MATPKPGYKAHFGLLNLPFGIASSQINPKPCCVSRFEDNVIWLSKIRDLQGVKDLPENVFDQPTLNDLAATPEHVHLEIRRRLRVAVEKKEIPEEAMEHISAVEMYLPVVTADFTDFSCSLDHVQNASEAVTGTRSTPPAFFHMPIGYAGRCSSLEVSGTNVERPLGQYWSGKPGQSEVVFGPCKEMDYELELACVIGKPVPRRDRVTASQAESHIFGYCLLNDWSGNICHKRVRQLLDTDMY
jgi:fumarylacetoacetase